MLKNINLSKVLFLDIETVPETYNFKKLNSGKKQIWNEKHGGEKEYPKSSMLSEFGKIICISVGFFNLKTSKRRSFRVKSFIGEEIEILENFKTLCDSHFHLKSSLLCAHNGREFDFPFIARRMIINKVKLPKILDMHEKKPWEIPHLDTLYLWKFGDYKSSISLRLLSEVLGLDSKKNKLKVKNIADMFYLEKKINKIVEYCENDVLTLSQVILRFRNDPELKDEEVIFLKN
jgi:DNA polymerase elongation subunit (family B)|tara:strand:+ start:388 stop:1086 length:699 start_codon:yes stop_codon:yes gene_type:complete